MLTAVAKKGTSKTKVASETSIRDELQHAKNIDITYLLIGEDGYPEQLAAIADAPPILTILGDASLLTKRSIAVVGARNSSAGGLKFTRSICGALSEYGFVIVSGMARGIDTVAHQASVAGGTIACLAGGIDVVYPQENTPLYEAIVQNGLLISEMAPGTKPLARHFPRRNRIISGLSAGLLVVEAARKSGSLITARYAAEQGREVFAVPGSPLDPRAQGTNQLIKDGAALIQSADDIIAELDAMPLFQKQPQQGSHTKPNAHINMHTEIQANPGGIHSEPTPGPAETSQKALANILELLNPVPAHIDDIVRISGIPAEKLLIEFTELELAGDILRHTGGKYSRIPPKNE